MSAPQTTPLDTTLAALGRVPLLAPEVLMPGLVLTVLWPILRILLASDIDAFLLAFLITLALRLAIQADMLILTATSRLGRRATILATLIFVPSLLALLLMQADPSWFQRFLSCYFLVMAVMFVLDLIDGSSSIARQRWPEIERPCARRVLSQIMVIFHLGMFLANETLISTSGYGSWLVFFGYMPLITHLVVQSLIAVLQEMAARRRMIC